MIAIEAADKTLCATLCARTGAAADAALVMKEGEAPLGFVLFTREGETLRLTALQAQDNALCDALLRAALNAGQADGARTAVFGCEAAHTLAQTKGYGDGGAEPMVEIADFFAKSACKAEKTLVKR